MPRLIFSYSLKLFFTKIYNIMSNVSDEKDKLAEVSTSILGITTAVAVGANTTVGSTLIMGIGHTVAGKIGMGAISVAIGVGVFPVLVGSAATYLAYKGIASLFKWKSSIFHKTRIDIYI